MPSGVGTGGWGTRPARPEKTSTAHLFPPAALCRGRRWRRRLPINGRSETGSPEPSR
jgi:hypothetical protein